VARSKTLLGDWEKNPANPILAANENWQCPGHGSVVTTADGRDFLLYHAYRKRSDAFNIGREALLDEVKFDADWPTINGGRGPSERAAVPFKETKQETVAALNDEFSGSMLAPRWSFPIFGAQATKLESGFLTIAPKPGAVIDSQTELLIAERTVSSSYAATTRVDHSKLGSGESAGISAYSWRGNAVGVSLGEGRVVAWLREGGKQREIAALPVPKNSTTALLRIQADKGESFQFSFSTDDGRTWQNIGEKVITSSIEGARIALIYSGRAAVPGAKFDWLHVEPN
jgi:beta-xylosidase